jgi:phosphoribosyl-ATP pyrophosphohydrolase
MINGKASLKSLKTPKKSMDNILNTLEKILEERKSSTEEKSYVSSLYSKGVNSILEKVSEESEEVIQAVKEEGRDEVIHEVADLWFHIMVLLRHEDISIEEIELELARRFGVSGHEEKASRKK